ncbi:Rieske (2Fe-2S) protein [Haladaptatus sp. DYSN1]|uniref:Rieske (2Fe-2S) protein n=1 Tax=unclassified Haladaptatus TaxID=2622732 RepID=UPI00240514A9|nr:Rieske (2Fe-2S) protein [Haladaptatus sp. DYSN1]
MAAEADFVPVASLSQLKDEGTQIVSHHGRSVALFYHEDQVYAVDNRCPHMGFPLSKGTVDEGVLTCHWHHARFELSCGDTFDPWADDVQTFPVRVDGDDVLIDPDPEPSVPPATHWRNRLADGLQENLSLVMAKAVIGLADEGEDPAVPIKTGVDFGTKYRDAGWGSGLTVHAAMANILPALSEVDQKRALYTGLRYVANDAAGEPPRFEQPGFSTTDVSKARLKSWFRETIEVRDNDPSERTLRTAIGSLPPEDVAEIMYTAATDHRYLNAGHSFDFVNKAFEVLDHIGWDSAPNVLPTLVDELTGATRSEELSSWRQPIDVAGLLADAYADLDEMVETGRGKTWQKPENFTETLLQDDPHAIVDALVEAVESGATTTELAHAVSIAAMRRVAHFATSNEFSDWNTVHHTFTYANAVEQATHRTDAVELYRGVFDGAISVYLDRFLNMPRAPLPEPGESDTDPADIRAQLMDAFDEEGEVNRAAALVSEHFDCGGDPADLIQTLGEALLREDANFHTLQNVEASFKQFEVAESKSEKRLALMATARYMAAHFPTRREAEQTFTIASRLHRGEKIYEE